jgi:uncharacterized protein (DUF2336 family)
MNAMNAIGTTDHVPAAAWGGDRSSRDEDVAFTVADVESLRRDRSPEARIALARKLGAGFDRLARGEHRDLTGAILNLLVRDMEKRVRSTLADLVASSPDLPGAIAERLARDEVEVAIPILERSPVLSEAVLTDIVRTNAMQYALAVAGREHLSEAIADALVDTRNSEVVLRLLGNASARLSVSTMRRIASDYGANRAIHDRLVQRPVLPPELVDQLIGEIGDRLEWELVRTRRITPDEARRLMRAASARAALGIGGASSDAPLVIELRARIEAHELDGDDVARFLRDGDVARFEISLALLAALDRTRIRQLLYASDRRQLAAICARAGLSTPHYLTVRMALELADESLRLGGQGKVYSGETLQWLQLQYERLRASPEAVLALIG